MIEEKNNDGFIANNLGFDLNYFYRKKKEAIINMAYTLNAEIYEGKLVRLIDKYNKNKESNENSIVLIKSGIFYKTFNNDAYIVAHLFNYKINRMSILSWLDFQKVQLKMLRKGYWRRTCLLL